MKRTDFIVPGESGEPIRCDLRSVHPTADGPIFIQCHGFKGFKDWGGWPYFRESIAGDDGASIGVNFSHNGLGDNPAQFDRLDLFKLDTFGAQARDLNRVISALKAGEIPSINPAGRKIIVIGHSRGGAAALAAAASDRNVAGLVLLASISRIPSVSEEEEADWRSQGVCYVKNSRTGVDMPLGVGLLDEMKAEPDLVRKRASAVFQPALIIHGDDDFSVPVSAAQELRGWLKNSELIILPGADHNFGTVHPFAGTTPDFEAVIRAVQSFAGRIEAAV